MRYRGVSQAAVSGKNGTEATGEVSVRVSAHLARPTMILSHVIWIALVAGFTGALTAADGPQGQLTKEHLGTFQTAFGPDAAFRITPDSRLHALGRGPLSKQQSYHDARDVGSRIREIVAARRDK
jgi:hypothetical protein